MKLEFEIYKHIADISKPNNGWIKELNYISWDRREPVYDIRTWTEDHTAGEMAALKQALLEMNRF